MSGPVGRTVNRISLIPALFYQRYRPLWDRLPFALGMAGLFTLIAQATAVFPVDWRTFIAVSVLIAGLVKPIAGYVFFVLALTLPLRSISIYIAALALALLILPIFFLNRHLTAVVLILVAPILSQHRIALMIPFLAGMWWFEWGGVLAGLGSAAWLKIFAGMCGIVPDLAQLSGRPLPAGQLIARFHEADSLQTLLWLVQPLTSDSQALLLHTLQILAWGLTGYGVGLVRRRIDGMRRPGVGLVASVGAGLVGLGVGSVGIPLALDLLELSDAHLSFLMECVWNGAAAMAVYAAYGSLARPAVTPSPNRIDPYRPPTRPALDSDPALVARPRPRDEEQTGIIMIDLD